jgi:hypothetical protein
VVGVAQPIARPTDLPPRLAGHEVLGFIAEPDGGFTDPLESAFDRVIGARVRGKALLIESTHVIGDSIAVRDDIREQLDPAVRRHAPDPGQRSFEGVRFQSAPERAEVDGRGGR